MKLRPYQETALRAFERSREKACLIVAPTGAGKGTMATELLVRSHRARKRAVFIVHRREIAHDITERLAARGVQVAQTLRSDRMVRVISVQQALNAHVLPVDLLIVDEAHHYAADEWRQVIENIGCRRICGFTATPQRADGRPLGDMFGKIIDTISYSQLTAMGLLVPARVLRPAQNLNNDLAQDPVDVYLRHAKGQQALIFVRRVDDANLVRDRLRQAGITAESVHAKTDKAKRDETMRRLEAGEIRAVTNVGTLTEGVDVPHVSVCILARPCAHASTYVQIVGRVLRAAPGKKLATVIDLVGASHRHGLPGANLDYNLEGDGLHVKQERQREDSRSGPSGPHREQEVLDLDLEVVHTYAISRPKEPPAPVVPKTKYKPEPAPKPAKPLRCLQLKPGGWWYYRRYTKDSGNSVTIALHTQDQAEAEHLRDLAEAGDLDAFEAGRNANRVKYGKKKYNPKSRPTPVARSDGFLFQDRGFWVLMWREHGVKRRLGLSTKDEAEAKETHRIFLEEGEEAARRDVLQRKRQGASIWQNRESQWWYLSAWNPDKTQKIKYALKTTDQAAAERMKALFVAGDLKAFEQAILFGADRYQADAYRRRKKGLARGRAARRAAE